MRRRSKTRKLLRPGNLLVQPITAEVRGDRFRRKDTAIKGEEQMALAAVSPDYPDTPVAAGVRKIGNPLPIRRPGWQPFDTGIAGQLALIATISINKVKVPTPILGALVDDLIANR